MRPSLKKKMIVQLSQTREQMWWKPCHDLGRNPACRMLCSRPLCPQKTIIGWHDILSSVKVKPHDTWESLEVPCPILSQDMQTKWTSTKYLVSLMPWRRGNHTFADSNANAEILTLAHWELLWKLMEIKTHWDSLREQIFPTGQLITPFSWKCVYVMNVEIQVKTQEWLPHFDCCSFPNLN